MKKIYLVGCPRSGTTLLQSLLASHPEIVSFPETHIFSRTMHINALVRFFTIYGYKKLEIVREILDGLSVPCQDHELPGTPIFFTKHWINQLFPLLDKIGNTYDQNGTATYLLEKTPRHLHFLHLIQQADPSAHFIHIIRKGENVVASLTEATSNSPDHWEGARSIKKSIFWWNRSIKISKHFIGTKNHHFVLYSDLVRNTEANLARLFKHLEISEFHTEAVNSFHETAEELITEDEVWKQNNTNDSIEKSRKFKALAQSDQDYISKNLIDFDFNSLLTDQENT
ncbi:MAG TPA: hypothetical protein DEQ34_02510 [Balneolaceae bacterium]|nr:hypothetical protein [Balneolaceae bacterium]|tara:strand:+ start:68637 stop:69488 length:852 start_codon:yes stop_codon:yes gene_type:complete